MWFVAFSDLGILQAATLPRLEQGKALQDGGSEAQRRHLR